MWLEDWRQSGKSAWAYAKENGLNPQTFVRWARAEPEEKNPLGEARVNFVEVPTQVMAFPSRVQEILIEKGDVKIHIPLGRGELLAVAERLMGAL